MFTVIFHKHICLVIFHPSWCAPWILHRWWHFCYNWHRRSPQPSLVLKCLLWISGRLRQVNWWQCRTPSTIELCYGLIIPTQGSNIFDPSIPSKPRLHSRFCLAIIMYTCTSITTYQSGVERQGYTRTDDGTDIWMDLMGQIYIPLRIDITHPIV